MGGHYGKCLVRAILAGMMISIGGCVYIASEVKWVGAVLFAVGLFTIFSFKLDLYTGKVGYTFDNPPSYLVDLLVIIIGNFIGCLIVGSMMPSETAQAMVEKKMALDPLSVLFRGVLCGMLMFIAADCYKRFKSFIATFVCVPVFILAGFEHSIADMFYFCSAGVFSVEALVFILIVILGNGIGGVLIPVCRKWMYEDEPAA